MSMPSGHSSTGTGVGSGVGSSVGSGVGTGVGSSVGSGVGSGVGNGVGSGVAFTVGFGEALLGAGVVRTDLMMAAAWAINLAIAEWVIRRPARRRAKRARRTRTALNGSS